ncbi:DUF1289 domain-containing protein [Pseudoalteromonas rubra]|uniref:DUF1289 domain-containing protein n=2 Tax=Pseudoalteromonas rubra TaxID=43658 RepID=A0A5S3UQX2_9GAMM|nr:MULTISPECIES: DUF1289 domain-containing protein [Pseudoalteromonas]MEC4089038.1 DUF1289 domain-containing protein [Pseudoalteromonas rubra]QPB86157.1 DUF1289 domain-containing protein [Pseudoalteromonas rubra]
MSVTKRPELTESETEIVPSPCIRHCCLDDNDVCVGCYRTLNEIMTWQSCDNEQKRAVLRACETRKRAN